MFFDEVRAHLTEGIIPFWQKLKDENYGGYFGYMDYEKNIDKLSEKGVIMHARILWFFSNAYKLFSDSSYLDSATHAFDFIINKCFDDQSGGVFWSVSYKGVVLDSTKHCYCHAFVLYALASYYDVTKSALALKKVHELYGIIESKFTDEYGYLEAKNRDFEPILNDKLSENGVMADKTMNTLLHVFEAYTEFYRVSGESSVLFALKKIINIFKTKVYNEKLGRFEVFFDAQMNSILDLHSYGHDIESAWLLDLGCEYIADNSLRFEVANITQTLTRTVFNRAYHDSSLLNENENGKDDKKRVWWVQAEAVLGFINGYIKNPEKIEYFDAALSIWGFIKGNVIDARSGSEWINELSESFDPIRSLPLASPWKSPYHNGRMCIEVLKKKNQILDREEIAHA